MRFVSSVKKIYLEMLFLGCGLFSSLSWAHPQCVDLFSSPQIQSSHMLNRVNLSSGNVFVIREPDNDLFEFQATLNKEGALSISAFLSVPEIGARSHLRGKELYREMMEFFGIDNIRTIKGMWIEGVNYNQYFKNRSLGFGKKDSALMTWSGRQAALYEFTTSDDKVHVFQDPMIHQQTINVIFFRQADE